MTNFSFSGPNSGQKKIEDVAILVGNLWQYIILLRPTIAYFQATDFGIIRLN
jgi:hypothetical protein